jgi:hypothetical protein
VDGGRAFSLHKRTIGLFDNVEGPWVLWEVSNGYLPMLLFPGGGAGRLRLGYLARNIRGESNATRSIQFVPSNAVMELLSGSKTEKGI